MSTIPVLQKATAKHSGYKDLLIGKVVLPSDDTEEADLSAEDKKALLSNETAYNDLLLACSDEVSFGIVDASQYNSDGDGNAQKEWKHLNECFELKTGATKLQCKASFNKCCLTTIDTDWDEWTVKLERIRQKLAVMQSTISEEDTLVHILNNMLKEYESVAESFEEKLEDGKLSL